MGRIIFKGKQGKQIAIYNMNRLIYALFDIAFNSLIYPMKSALNASELML